jgi:lipoprotein-anchoring transpeptidase ErfK/SrfK
MVLIVGVVAVAVGLAFGYDRAIRDRMLEGVQVGGLDVGGMTKGEARRAIATVTASLLSRPFIVHAGDRTIPTDAKRLGVGVDVNRAVRQAITASRSFGWPSRIYHRFVSTDVSIRLPLQTDDAEIESFIDRLAADLHRAPVDAELRASDNGLRLVKQHAVPGRELDVERSVDLLTKALNRGETEVTLPTRSVPPQAERPGMTITVDLSTNRLMLWDDFRVVRRYPVGTAQKGFRTPVGEWTVIDKERRPNWVNPDPTGWGADMPLRIPPGPKNPLGLRALHLDAPGIAIHGTPDPETVGDYVSHGCIRMFPRDVERLFRVVRVGTPVLVYGSPPWGTKGGNGVPGV